MRGTVADIFVNFVAAFAFITAPVTLRLFTNLYVIPWRRKERKSNVSEHG